jgi:hypothetical protein
MALSTLPPPEHDRIPDDYIIEREDERVGPPVTTQIVTGLRGLMVAVLVLVSLALFWVVGTMIGLF